MLDHKERIFPPITPNLFIWQEKIFMSALWISVIILMWFEPTYPTHKQFSFWACLLMQIFMLNFIWAIKPRSKW